MNGEHIVVVGAGVNGSHLLPHIARMAQVARISVVDPDSYTASNLMAQNIDRLDVGKPKAWAQAQKLRLINPRLTVDPIVARIEDVPLALLMCAVIVGCSDSRRSRQWINEIACRLNAAFVDLGVLGSQDLARVTVSLPSENAPCLECNWGPDDYAQVEQEYPCAGGEMPGYPTMALSALGALAASLAALEVARVLAGDLGSAVAGREVVVDARHHEMLVTTCRRNSACRLDHRNWVIERWECRPETTTVWSTIEALGEFRVAGHRFVTVLACPACGLVDRGLKLNRPAKMCPWCRRRMVMQDFDARCSLDSGLPDKYRGLTLAQIGLRPGDVITCGDRHFHLLTEGLSTEGA